MSARLAAAALAVTLAAGTAAGAGAAGPAECVIIGRRDGGAPSISDPKECALATAPASTFKIPHALIALQTGVIAADTEVPWDGTKYDSPLWQRPHTVTSAIQWSALPFFQRTARLVGRDRMRAGLHDLGYAADDFAGDISAFWLNGDLVVTPLEQFAFLQRVFAGRVPIDAAHVATVTGALEMPPGAVTNASGRHPFVVTWPPPVVVHAKTGNTTVAGERVSWVVGQVASGGVPFVVVARVRAAGDLAGTAGIEAARRALNAYQRTP